MWPVGFCPETAAAVGLVVRVVAREPHGLRVALEGEDVRGNPVQKPAIVTHHDGTSRELDERVLERSERVDIEVVGWLVEQKEIRVTSQQRGKMHAVPLATRKGAARSLLVTALEIEPRDVGPRRDGPPAENDLILPARDRLPDRLLGFEFSTLVDVSQRHRLAHTQRPGGGFLFT